MTESRTWTMEEISIVEAGVKARLPIAEICAQLPDRDKAAVKSQCKPRRVALGIRLQRDPWTPAMIKTLNDGLAERLSYAEIAAKLGLDRKTVRRKARYLSLPPAGADNGYGWSTKRLASMDARFSDAMREAMRRGQEPSATVGIVKGAGTDFPRSLPRPAHIGVGSPAAMCADMGE